MYSSLVRLDENKLNKIASNLLEHYRHNNHITHV